MKARTKPRKQCGKCPWKKNTDPFEIPNGYSEDRHRGLKNTVAEPGRPCDVLHLMACHDTPVGEEKPCVGWLINQLGVGNNITLRLRVTFGQIDGNVETTGPQHATLEDTFPSRKRVRK